MHPQMQRMLPISLGGKSEPPPMVLLTAAQVDYWGWLTVAEEWKIPGLDGLKKRIQNDGWGVSGVTEAKAEVVKALGS